MQRSHEAKTVVVISDAHFGDPQSELRHPHVQAAVVGYLAKLGQIDELVLLGDVLDLNYGTWTAAIEGLPGRRNSPPSYGFRAFLQHLEEHRTRNGQPLVKRYVYVVGNHDYMVFDHLERERILGRLSGGGHLRGEIIPRDELDDCFLNGLLAAERRSALSVVYPDHTVELGGREVLLTHGHHLDRKQTLFCPGPLAQTAARQPSRRFLLDFEFGIAQQQWFARALTMHSRRRVRIHCTVDIVAATLAKWNEFLGRTYHPLGKSELQAILSYCRLIAVTGKPKVFVFGHTHHPEDRFINSLRMALLNPGSFLTGPLPGRGSFLVLRANDSRLAAELVELRGTGEEVTVSTGACSSITRV